MEYFLLYAIGLSLISLLCMALAKTPSDAPPHADSDTELNLFNASMPLPPLADFDRPLLPNNAGATPSEWSKIYGILEEEAPKAVSDSVNPFAEN
ncbi:MAG: hypothetical protein AAFP19_04305 [Bacteroidota bacterium]